MDVLGMTIIFIAGSTLVSAILKVIRKDKCLKDFDDFNVSIFTNKNEKYYGKMRLESTGMELSYKMPYIMPDERKESSYILYKKEYSNLKTIARLHFDLTAEGKELREKALKQSYHPGFFRRLERKIQNFLKTVKGAIAEVVGLLVSRVQKTASSSVQAQNQQIEKVKKDLFGASASFDPLLEHHIGNIIILEIEEADEQICYHGVLKEYTSEFYEIMDVDFMFKNQIEKADLIVPRANSAIRHLGE
jgi:hypothetical protein